LTVALLNQKQPSAHHHQLAQLELKAMTARAQIRALQAQINPTFPVQYTERPGEPHSLRP